MNLEIDLDNRKSLSTTNRGDINLPVLNNSFCGRFCKEHLRVSGEMKDTALDPW